MSEADKFTIGEASTETGLPESTIRYYDREFGDYLSIDRGKNNQRLFDEENLKDLEYIRYLLKREDFTVREVKEKLDSEEDLRARGDFEAEETEVDDNEPAEKMEPAPGMNQEAVLDKISALEKKLEALDERLEKLEAGQEKIRELLDMNLERYNELVDNIL